MPLRGMPQAEGVALAVTRLFAVLVVPAAVVVASVLLFVRMKLEPPTVPPYVLAATGEAGPSRPDAPSAMAPMALRRGGRFTLAAEPLGMVQGAVGARAFLVRGEDEVRLWEPPFSVDRDGSVHIEGAAAVLFRDVPSGPWEIDVAIGRPETLPTAPRDILRARTADAGSGAGWAPWQLVRERVDLAD
jgi:hypothetical protein